MKQHHAENGFYTPVTKLWQVSEVRVNGTVKQRSGFYKVALGVFFVQTDFALNWRETENGKEVTKILCAAFYNGEGVWLLQTLHDRRGSLKHDMVLDYQEGEVLYNLHKNRK